MSNSSLSSKIVCHNDHKLLEPSLACSLKKAVLYTRQQLHSRMNNLLVLITLPQICHDYVLRCTSTVLDPDNIVQQPKRSCLSVEGTQVLALNVDPGLAHVVCTTLLNSLSHLSRFCGCGISPDRKHPAIKPFLIVCFVEQVSGAQ